MLSLSFSYPKYVTWPAIITIKQKVNRKTLHPLIPKCNVQCSLSVCKWLSFQGCGLP